MNYDMISVTASYLALSAGVAFALTFVVEVGVTIARWVFDSARQMWKA